MAALLTQTAITCDFSCLTFHQCPLMSSAALQFSVRSISTFYSQVGNFKKASSTGKLKLPVRKECFQPTNSMHVCFKCCCCNTLVNSQTEMGVVFSFFREIGIGHEETETLLVNHPEFTLVSMDSMRARVLSLQSIGLDRLALYYVITKRPTSLIAKEVEPLLRFLRDELQGQLEQAQIKRLLSATEPRSLVGFDKKVALLVNRGIPREKIVHVLNNVNLTKALCHRSVDEIDRIMAFLDRFGGISLIVKRPSILNFDLDCQLIPRTGLLVKLSGGDEDAAGTVLRKLPAILNYSVEHMEGHVELLRSFAGLSDEQIFRIMLVFPNIISASRERKLRPRIQFLKECGLNSEDIFKFLIKAPLFLGHSFHDNIAYKLAFLVKIGYKHRTKDMAMAIGSTTRTSCENLQKVMGLFLSYGFSFVDIVAMSKRHPQILQYKHISSEKKIEYLVGELGRDKEELLVFPAFLGYKLDARIKLRYEEKKGVRGEGMSLNKLLTVSTERFTGQRKKAKPARARDSLKGKESS